MIFDHTYSVTIIDCASVELTHNFADNSTIEVIREYGVTIHFPQIFFAGPHTIPNQACQGEYQQNLLAEPVVPRVRVNLQGTTTDSRPALIIDTTAAVRTFTLTFSCEYSFGGQVLTKTVS